MSTRELEAQQQQQTLSDEVFRNFIDSIDNEITKRSYRYSINYFMNFLRISRYEDLISLSSDTKKLEGFIRDYITYMRQDRKLSSATVSVRIAAISHFYEMNDVIINWRELKKFKGRHRNITEDRPYTRDEIKKLVDVAPLRDKAIILLMASSGVRRGAIPFLRVRDITRIDEYKQYKINVYKKEQESYITYCTPECTKFIEQYMKWRERLGEKITPNTPLFRTEFDPVLQLNRPQAIGVEGIAGAIKRLINDTAARISTGGRTEIMQTHGFRKFFKTTCINAGMNPLYSEYVMGHRSGLTKSYFKPTDQELLEGNDKALVMWPQLTI